MERTHYHTHTGPSRGGEVILYRTIQKHLCYSYRADPSLGVAGWSVPMPAAIPDIDANINAGTLHVGTGTAATTYLLHNPVVNATHTRDPLVVSLSMDGGATFTRSFIAATCLLPPYSNPLQPDGCAERHAGKGKSPGQVSFPRHTSYIDCCSMCAAVHRGVGGWHHATFHRQHTHTQDCPGNKLCIYRVALQLNVTVRRAPANLWDGVACTGLRTHRGWWCPRRGCLLSRSPTTRRTSGWCRCP